MQEQRRVRDQQEEPDSLQSVSTAQMSAGWYVEERQSIWSQV
nr:unnamed protein product [Callosobruchus analis]